MKVRVIGDASAAVREGHERAEAGVYPPFDSAHWLTLRVTAVPSHGPGVDIALAGAAVDATVEVEVPKAGGATHVRLDLVATVQCRGAMVVDAAGRLAPVITPFGSAVVALGAGPTKFTVADHARDDPRAVLVKMRGTVEVVGAPPGAIVAAPARVRADFARADLRAWEQAVLATEATDPALLGLHVPFYKLADGTTLPAAVFALRRPVVLTRVTVLESDLCETLARVDRTPQWFCAAVDAQFARTAGDPTVSADFVDACACICRAAMLYPGMCHYKDDHALVERFQVAVERFYHIRRRADPSGAASGGDCEDLGGEGLLWVMELMLSSADGNTPCAQRARLVARTLWMPSLVEPDVVSASATVQGEGGEAVPQVHIVAAVWNVHRCRGLPPLPLGEARRAAQWVWPRRVPVMFVIEGTNQLDPRWWAVDAHDAARARRAYSARRALLGALGANGLGQVPGRYATRMWDNTVAADGFYLRAIHTWTGYWAMWSGRRHAAVDFLNVTARGAYGVHFSSLAGPDAVAYFHAVLQVEVEVYLEVLETRGQGVPPRVATVDASTSAGADKSTSADADKWPLLARATQVLAAAGVAEHRPGTAGFDRQGIVLQLWPVAVTEANVARVRAAVAATDFRGARLEYRAVRGPDARAVVDLYVVQV